MRLPDPVEILSKRPAGVERSQQWSEQEIPCEQAPFYSGSIHDKSTGHKQTYWSDAIRRACVTHYSPAFRAEIFATLDQSESPCPMAIADRN